jgi:D-amino peptidase
MKIFIMTDQEGVAGVVNKYEYSMPGARLYELACELTTLETNAAIEGALEAGGTDFFVVDGHGYGSIDITKLHPRATVLTGSPLTYPFGCDATFDAAFSIGQHAKSNADGGHLCHTGSFRVEDQTINGIPVGELAVNTLVCSYFGVPMTLVTGDQACADEAKHLIPNIETAVVKWGIRRGSAKGLSLEENELFNGSAIHLTPEKSREVIRESAYRALRQRTEISSFHISGPYERITTLRRTKTEPQKRHIETAEDLLQLLNGQGTVNVEIIE